jgi:hypothetical protein
MKVFFFLMHFSDAHTADLRTVQAKQSHSGIYACLWCGPSGRSLFLPCTFGVLSLDLADFCCRELHCSLPRGQG